MVGEVSSRCRLKQICVYGSLTNLQVSVTSHADLLDDIAMGEYKKSFLFLLLFWMTDLISARLYLCATPIARKINKFEWREE